MSGGASRHTGVALLLVDLQNAYFEAPELDEVKDELIERANELVVAAREADRPVVLVRTEHDRDKSTWTVNMLADDEGFAFPGTAQASYVDALDTEGGLDVTKTRDDAFHGTRLREILTELQVSHLLIGGVSTHSCVAETAMAAFAHDLHVAIAGDVIASENPTLSEAMLEFLTDELRQPVLDQEGSIALLREGPAEGE
ncbi:cysteine hydrolase family protein [Pseudactinotalea suaedae]|uniref:cysteine hydrolase family protein n=1 Tax=Pseudactinotalea suaedae TaxID=1524924 RepID=UPI001F4F1BAF|nr:isochorismatase family cysteine hydrolase [Pseudactinotalea suaedae]